MKKLIAMIGAVAMSFGLFADAPAPFAISYEATETDVSEGAWTPGSQWSWGGDAIPVITDLTRVLPYEAAGSSKARRNDVFMNVTGGTDNDNYADLSTGSDELTLTVDSGNVFLDQLVKFTGFEDPQTNLLSGTKIAIWMSEFENEDESTSTNLYITCGKNVDGTYEQVALQIEGTYELNTWYRLTVKSLGDIFDAAPGSTARAGFLVWVNGSKAICEDAKALLGDDADLIKDAKKTSFYNAGRLFPAFAASATLATVGYQGIGAIDDIIVDANGPEFCVETVDVAVALIEGAEFEVWQKGVKIDADASTGKFTLDPGDYTVKYKAADGWVLTAKEIAHNTSEGDIDDSEEIEPVAAAVMLTHDSVNTYYTQEGFEALLAGVPPAAVVDGDVITVLQEVVKMELGVMLYKFTPGTTIAIADVKEEDAVVAVKWTVTVPDYEMEGEEEALSGELTFNLGLAAGKQIEVTFTDTGVESGTATFSGEIAEGAFFKLVNGYGVIEGTVLAAEGAKIIVPTDMFEGEVTVGDDLSLDVDTETEEGYTIYSAAQSEPEPTTDTVTFTVTYDADEVENVTVTTNGEDVVKLGGLCYVVESNAFVTITATAKTGYQNVTITGDNVTVTEGVFKADKAETAITITAEEIPVPGFMIRLAGIDAADVEEGTDSITIKTEAQPLVYINGAAATVAGEAGAWTVTKPEITADTAISIVKGANIPTTGHAWYENPTLMGKTKVLNTADNDGAGGYNGGLDLAGDYIAGAFGYTSQGLILTTVSDLFTDTGDGVDPILTVSAADSINKSVRGAAVSTALGVMVVGSAGSNPIAVYSLDGSRTNLVTTSNGVTPDSFAFSADGKYMWANAYKPSEDRNKVFLYEVKDNLIGDGEKLVLKETYVVGTRVRGIRVFGNHVYAKGDPDDEPGWLEEGWYHMDASADTPAFTKIGDLFWDKNADDISIVGDHLYAIATGSKLNVYNLDADGVWVDGDPIKVVDLASIGVLARDSGNSFFVSDDEETFIAFNRDWAAKKNTIAAYQWTLPTYDITFDASVENGTLETSITNGIAAGAPVTVYAKPATGYECTEITTNGTAITGTSFDMPADDVEIGATFTLQQFTVSAITVDNATAVATNTATDTGLDLPATVDYNTAIAVTVTPNTDYEYKTTPAGWTKNDNGSITTNATVTADLAITVEAPTAADPWNPPTDDGEASQKIADLGFSTTAVANITTVAEFTKFENYVKTASGKTDPGTLTANQKANAYLAYALNATAIPDAAIESDDVEITSFEGGVIEITIEGIEVGSDVPPAMIAKVIDVVGNDELTEMSAENVTTTGRAGVNGKVQVTVAPAADFAESTKFFYRASVKK